MKARSGAEPAKPTAPLGTAGSPNVCVTEKPERPNAPVAGTMAAAGRSSSNAPGFGLIVTLTTPLATEGNCPAIPRTAAAGVITGLNCVEVTINRAVVGVMPVLDPACVTVGGDPANARAPTAAMITNERERFSFPAFGVIVVLAIYAVAGVRMLPWISPGEFPPNSAAPALGRIFSAPLASDIA